NHILIVDVEKRVCHFGCAYTFLKDRVKENICFEGRLTILKQMHEIIHPGKEIVPAPDWRLHKRNGGEMDDAKYHERQTVYIAQPRLKIVNCIVPFVRA